MKRRALIVLAGVAAAAALSVAPAIAAPGENGNGVGGCTAGNFYGNTTNPRPSGNGVLPTQGPGPWVNNPSDPKNPTPGMSIGEAHQFAHAVAGAPAGNYTGRDINQILCSTP